MGVFVKVGPKGQILIPKVFRDALDMEPGSRIELAERNAELVLKKPDNALAQVFENIAFSGKSVKLSIHADYDEEIEQRLERK